MELWEWTAQTGMPLKAKDTMSWDPSRNRKWLCIYFLQRFLGHQMLVSKNIMLLIQASIAWVSIISKILQGHQQANSLAAFSPDKVQTYTSSGRNEAIFSNDA